MVEIMFPHDMAVISRMNLSSACPPLSPEHPATPPHPRQRERLRSHGAHPGDPAPHPRSPRAAVKTRGGHDREMNVNGPKKNKDSLILTGHESPHVLGCQDHQVNMAVKPFLELH